MSNDEFKYYYNAPTKIKGIALNYARTLTCEPSCHNHCTRQCLTHAAPNINVTYTKYYYFKLLNINTNIKY